MLRLSIVFICALMLQACNKLDDYMLGKDNTPIPDPLPKSTKIVKMQQAWTVDVGAKTKGLNENLAPVVRGHRFYLALPGGQVQKRNIQTGRLYWQQSLPSGISSGPTTAEGVVAVTTDRSSVVVLSQKDGQILWEKKVSGKVLAKPLIALGKVLVKTASGNIHVFEIKNAQKAWQWQHGSPDLILKASSSPILIPPTTVLVGYADGKLDAIDMQNGNLLWQKGLVYASGASDVERLVDIDADPIYYNNMVLLGSYQGFVGALSIESKEFLWRKPASIYQNMAVGGGRLYVADENDIIWSIDPNNGQTNWQQIHLKARRVTSPVWSPVGILIADKTGLLHVLSSANGGLIGRMSISGAISTPPVMSGNRALIVTDNGQLYAIDLTR